MPHNNAPLLSVVRDESAAEEPVNHNPRNIEAVNVRGLYWPVITRADGKKCSPLRPTREAGCSVELEQEIIKMFVHRGETRTAKEAVEFLTLAMGSKVSDSVFRQAVKHLREHHLVPIIGTPSGGFTCVRSSSEIQSKLREMESRKRELEMACEALKELSEVVVDGHLEPVSSRLDERGRLLPDEGAETRATRRRRVMRRRFDSMSTRRIAVRRKA